MGAGREVKRVLRYVGLQSQRHEGNGIEHDRAATRESCEALVLASVELDCDNERHKAQYLYQHKHRGAVVEARSHQGILLHGGTPQHEEESGEHIRQADSCQDQAFDADSELHRVFLSPLGLRIIYLQKTCQEELMKIPVRAETRLPVPSGSLLRYNKVEQC